MNQEPEGGEDGRGEGGEEAEEGGAEEQQEVVEGAEDDDETHIEAVDVVDEGEQNPKVRRQYERELEDNERALEDDSSYYNFSQLAINVGEHVLWE
jgi:hypothetical protein